jgi:hypothetical protein
MILTTWKLHTKKEYYRTFSSSTHWCKWMRSHVTNLQKCWWYLDWIKFISYLIIYLFFAALGLELKGYTSSHSTSPFSWWVIFFWDKVLWSICPGCIQTLILLISASWVARITGPNSQHPALFLLKTINK